MNSIKPTTSSSTDGKMGQAQPNLPEHADKTKAIYRFSVFLAKSLHGQFAHMPESLPKLGRLRVEHVLKASIKKRGKCLALGHLSNLQKWAEYCSPTITILPA